MSDEIVDQSDDHISIDIGLIQLVNEEGQTLIQKDYRVGGEVWRVHKYDPDPLPSAPHAHCIDGRKRFGYKLHLGTAEVFHSNNDPTGYRLERKYFLRLCELVSKKFPHLVLPLATSAE
ncbi:hypothetical protein ACFLEY_03850 [Bradyrhizobium sp. YCK136]|uniref:hypothetical protein n=1 Tax=Bradyrhizobium sp. YCK136 TaxID=3351346 RepID=UPI0037C6A0DE